MTRRSRTAQLALASLLSLTAVDILFVFLVAVDVMAGDEALAVASPKMIYFVLLTGLAAFSLPLMWWENRLGYYVAVAIALISLSANASGVWSALSGAVVVDLNILSGAVGLVFSAILLVSGAIASRGWSA